MTQPENSLSAQQIGEICFGLDRETDERSLFLFLQQFTGDELLATLISRMTDDDITTTLDFLTSLMHKYLQEKEYHKLFLREDKS